MEHRNWRERAFGGGGIVRVMLLLAALVAVVGGLAAPLAAANPARVEFVRAISPPNPFPEGCGLERLTRDMEDETWLAVNPGNPENLVAAWRQDRQVGLPTANTVLAVTNDGGENWSHTTTPGVTACTGGNYEFQTDPWVSAGAGNRFYFTSVAGRRTGLPGQASVSGDILAHASPDAGATWLGPANLTAIRSGTQLNDKEVLAADPQDPLRATAIWTALPEFLNQVSFTSDGGKTWTAPKTIKFPTDAWFAFPSQLLALGDGTLIAVYTLFEAQYAGGSDEGDAPIAVMRSADRGQTWSEPVHLSRGPRRPFFVRDPDSGQPLNRGFPTSYAGAAVTADGTAFVAWANNTSVRAGRIELSYSRDAGRTWSAPRAVSTISAQTFLPAVATMGDGTVGVTYQDYRNDKPGDRELTTDVWFSHSHDLGGTWEETHLAGPYNSRDPDMSYGEYQAAVGLPGGFGATFVQGRPQARQGSTDIFFGRLSVAPGRCLARRSPIGPRNIGRIRLGYTRSRLLRLPVEPVRRTRRSFRYCVKASKGRVSAVFSRRGRVVLVITTARSHGNRRVRPGSPRSALRRGYPRRRGIGRGVYRANGRSPRLIGISRGRVRFVALADRRLLRNTDALRRLLRLAGF